MEISTLESPGLVDIVFSDRGKIGIVLGFKTTCPDIKPIEKLQRLCLQLPYRQHLSVTAQVTTMCTSGGKTVCSATLSCTKCSCKQQTPGSTL